MAASQSRGRVWIKVLAVWIVIIIGIFGTAELAVRVLLHVPASPYEQMTLIHSRVGFSSFNDVFRYDDARFWRNREGMHGVRILGDLFGRPIDFQVNTDACGMRVTQEAPCAERDAIRVLALGDSCTFGFGVNDDDAWPNKLQQLLNAKSEGHCFKVFNAGVPAYTSFQCLQYLRNEGLALKPRVVIAQFWINDSMSWGFGDYHILKQLHPPLLIRMLSKSQFFHLLQAILYGLLSPDRARLLPDEFERTVSEFVELCRHNQILVVLALWPGEQSWKNGVLEPYPAALKQFAVDHGIPYVDALPAIHQKPGPWYVDVYHASVEGNAVMAELLAPEIQRLCK